MENSCEVSSSTITSNTMDNGSPKDPVPAGTYTFVGVDIDTTGRRLIDEIVQLAAYTPTEQFSQYIMPYMNLNPAARQRHQVRVVSVGFYRMLKSNQTYKVIKSKSEIAALRDFLLWLEEVKTGDPETDGIVMIYHEERKFIPYMILEAMQKYNLLDRFFGLVKSFVNGVMLAKESITEPNGSSYSIRKLSKRLGLNNYVKEEGEDGNRVRYSQALFEGNASVRARLAYQIAYKLSNQDKENKENGGDSTMAMNDALLRFASKPVVELDELGEENRKFERQNSFRPVFLNYFKTAIYQRVRAVKFRIQISNAGYELGTFQKAWTAKQKQGIVELLEPIEDLKDADKAELADLFDSFFDPEKKTLTPPARENSGRNKGSQSDGNEDSQVEEGYRGRSVNRAPRYRRAGRNRRQNGTARGNGTEHGAGGDKECTMPDSTSKSPNDQNNNRGPQRQHSNSVGRQYRGGRRNRNSMVRQRYRQNNNNRQTAMASN